MENIENKQSKNDIESLFSEMITQNIDHQETQIHECYGKIFSEKVEKFEQVEGKIGLLLQLIQSKARLGSSAILNESEVLAQKHEKLLSEIKQNFDFIKSKGFGLKQTTYSTPGQSAQSKSFHGFNFRDLDSDDISMKTSDSTTPIYGHITDKMTNNVPFGPKSSMDEEDLNQSINMHHGYNSKIPPRLRYKRSFAAMTPPESNKSPEVNDNDSSENDVKRKLLELE